ncbi:MAG: hypothetical protein WBV94_21455 [Blastocatellia bacterium]
MPPQLTEAWASVYLQILIGLLIFALGIPAFILQLVVHEDIRHVTDRRMNVTWWRLSMFLLGIASVAFIWYLHPTKEAITGWQRWIASLIVTLVPITVAYFGLQLLGNFQREKVIKDLEEWLIKKSESGGSIKTETLDDFIYLGERSKAGYQKNLVLKSYKEIVKTVQSSSNYKGEELKDLILSLIEILKSGEVPGDEDNYFKAAELLAFIQTGYSEKPRYSHRDLDSIRITLTELGLEAVKSKSERTVLKLLNVATSCNSDIVLKMGISAFRSRRFFIAADALNILETEVGREPKNKHSDVMMRRDHTSRLLGLISHFAVSGEAARRRARTSFALHAAGFYAPLKDCLKESLEYFYYTSDFDTSDNIAVMLKFVENGLDPVPN